MVIRFIVRISTYRSEARLRGLRVTAQRSRQRNEQRAGCVWWICKLSGDAFISVFGNAPTFICMSTYIHTYIHVFRATSKGTWPFPSDSSMISVEPISTILMLIAGSKCMPIKRTDEAPICAHTYAYYAVCIQQRHTVCDHRFVCTS